jgi:thioredoxin reductase
LATAKITSGICGFTATVEARQEGRQVKLIIESECKAIQALAEELTEVDPFQEISFRREGPRTLKAGAKHCYHPACPVPVGIIKAVEIEAGLALPAEARIELSKGNEG